MNVIATCFMSIFGIVGATGNPESPFDCEERFNADTCLWHSAATPPHLRCRWCPKVGKSGVCQSAIKECSSRSAEEAGEVVSLPASPAPGSRLVASCAKTLWGSASDIWDSASCAGIGCQWCKESGVCRSSLGECRGLLLFNKLMSERKKTMSPSYVPSSGEEASVIGREASSVMV